MRLGSTTRTRSCHQAGRDSSTQTLATDRRMGLPSQEDREQAAVFSARAGAGDMALAVEKVKPEMVDLGVQQERVKEALSEGSLEDDIDGRLLRHMISPGIPEFFDACARVLRRTSIAVAASGSHIFRPDVGEQRQAAFERVPEGFENMLVFVAPRPEHFIWRRRRRCNFRPARRIE